jgi:hypothetical protein
MQEILPSVCKETIHLLDEVKPEKVIFSTFSDIVTCKAYNFGSAKKKIEAARANGMTAMYDGVTTMLLELIKLSRKGHPVLAIVVTDGMENSSCLFDKGDLVEAKNTLRSLAGEDCIREICISKSIEAAANLQDCTPGLRKACSQTAVRSSDSIRNAFQRISSNTQE